jgi:transposase
VPALSPYIIDPIWKQFEALLPERDVDHPLGCHNPRIPDRVVFEKLVQVLVFGCAYERIADTSCSATTLRRRRDEWIDSGVMERLRGMVLDAYDRMIGLDLSDVAVDCCITKAPCGGEKAGRSPVDRGKRGIKRSMVVDANGIPLGAIAAPANRHDSPLLGETLDTMEALGELPERMSVHLDRGYDSGVTRERLGAESWWRRSPSKAGRLRLRRPSVGWWSARPPGATLIRSWCGVQSASVQSSISGSPSRR